MNWWCGPDEAVSAMHKDPYENLYCVVKGTKIFTLLPQSALPFLSTTFGVPAHFVHETTRKVDPERSLSFYEHTKWKVEVDQQEIHEDEDGNKVGFPLLLPMSFLYNMLPLLVVVTSL